MVALLKEDGEFTPMPVVRDTTMLKQLLDSMESKTAAPSGLVSAIRTARIKYAVVSK
ncbi:hypothetical protein [Agrobacterium sp. CNPSo 2736]|uniref:hypothetical protein n=1 Tax=Agrobacterium sp. CNPSo 2736 TaxID=2499627 RepID=UPI0013E3BA28|nr:hypothetical protein [Agrobacterium sp. CNPSo 2736]